MFVTAGPFDVDTMTEKTVRLHLGMIPVWEGERQAAPSAFLLDSQLRGRDGVGYADIPPETHRPTFDSMKQCNTHADVDLGTQ